MSLSRRAWLHAAAVAAAGPWLASVGCASRSVRSEVTAGLFEKADLSYQIRGSKLQDAWDAGKPAVEQVSYDPERPQPPEKIKSATLSIDYPHPGRVKNKAQARLEFVGEAEHGGGWLSWRTQPQVWVTDISVAEMQTLVAKIGQAEMFEPSKTLFADATVIANVDGEESKYLCDSIPELDALVTRIRRDGRPVKDLAWTPEGDLVRAPKPIPPEETPSSIAALRKHEQQARLATEPRLNRLPAVNEILR